MDRDSNGVLISKYQYLDKESQDIDLYFTLVSAREEGNLSEEDTRQLQSIVSKYEWAKQVEEAYQEYKNGLITRVDYMRVYVPILYKLQDKIDEYTRKDNHLLDDEEKLEEESHGLELPPDIKEYARYLKLRYLADRGQLSEEENKELYEIISRNERAASLEIAKRLLSDSKITKEDYYRVYDKYRKELKDAILEANEVRENIDEKETSEEYALPKEYEEYLKYLKLNILDNSNALSPTGRKELEEIISNNKMAQDIEKAKGLLKEGKITKEELDELLARYRKELNDAFKELNNRKKQQKEELTGDKLERKEYSDEDLLKLEDDIINSEKIKEKDDDPKVDEEEDTFNPIIRDPYLDFIYNMFNGKKITKIDNSNLDEVKFDKEELKEDNEKNTSHIEEKGKEEKEEEKTSNMDKYYEERFPKEPKEKPLTRPLIENPQNKMDEYYNREFRVPIFDTEESIKEEKEEEKTSNMDKYYEERFPKEPKEKPLTMPLIKNPQNKMDEHYNREFRVPINDADEYIPKHAKSDEIVEEDKDYIPKHAKNDEEIQDKTENKDMIKTMRETLDHYMAYQKGLNSLKISDIGQLLDLLSTYKENANEEEEHKTR